MTLKELIKEYKGQYADIEIYEPNDTNNYSDCFHTDNCTSRHSVEEYPDTMEVGLYELMDEEDYNNSILANSEIDADFDDWYDDKDAKVLCVMTESKYLTLKEIRNIKGLSQQDVSNLLGIPKRTIEQWETGKRKAPDYVYKLVSEKLLSMRYELRELIYETKNLNEIQELAACNLDDNDPVIIRIFDSSKAAEQELKKYTTQVRELSGDSGTYYQVTQYYIEENEYNDDGEWINGGNVIDWSRPQIEVVENNTYDIIGTFNDINKALECKHKFDEDSDNGSYLSF